MLGMVRSSVLPDTIDLGKNGQATAPDEQNWRRPGQPLSNERYKNIRAKTPGPFSQGDLPLYPRSGKTSFRVIGCAILAPLGR